MNPPNPNGLPPPNPNPPLPILGGWFPGLKFPNIPGLGTDGKEATGKSATVGDSPLLPLIKIRGSKLVELEFVFWLGL